MHRRAGHKLTDLVGDRDLACASRADRLRVELADEREDELLLLDDRCSASGAFARVRRGSMGSPERIHPRGVADRVAEITRRAVVSRRIFPFLVGVTAGLALLAGFIVTLIDRQDFPTFGTGVWWAIVTLGTVGYGDVVPHSAWGRVVGSVVIVIGVTFISFLTAIVTSYFVSAEQAEAEQRERQRTDALAEALESLRRIEQRLATLEAKLPD
jgi:voltage-gated potassium channel